MWYLRPEPVPRDPETLCPVAGPRRITAILVDTTDRVGAISREDILRRLDELVSSSEPDEMMVAYETSPLAGDESLLPPRLRVCNPGNPDEANPLIANPELIRQRLEEHFRAPLNDLFRTLLNHDPAPSSPLMENIQAISVTRLARRLYAEIPKRLVLISDLMQHSEHLSVYGQLPDYDIFNRTPGADALRTNLQDVRVEVFFVQRREHERFDGTLRLIEFWERWIDGQQGQLARVEKIDGLN